MNRWPAEARRRLRGHSSVVRVVVAQARGSTPREAGAVMLVDAEAVHGTIGGGELEWRALSLARRMLPASGSRVRVERWPLGPELGQCCGGSVTLWFERIEPADEAFLADLESRLDRGETGWLVSRAEGLDAPGCIERHWLSEPPESTVAANHLVEQIGQRDFPVWLFGAGHVGRALAAVLETLPFPLTVFDSRESALDGLAPGCANRVLADDPACAVARAPAGSILLVMTHSHETDYTIVRAALSRGDLGWVGLIGSDTKATCFRLRLSRDGIDDARIAMLVSPIGVDGIRSKHPAAIAVAVAAQILQRSGAAHSGSRRGEPRADPPGLRIASGYLNPTSMAKKQ